MGTQEISDVLLSFNQDMQNPLTAIKGYARLLLQGTLGGLDKEQKEAVISIANSAQDLVDIMDNFFDYFGLGDLSVNPLGISDNLRISEPNEDNNDKKSVLWHLNQDHQTTIPRKRILIVEDKPEWRMLMEASLQGISRACSIDAVSGAVHAYERVANEKYDLVISDYKMMDVDGIELLRRIRQISPETSLVLMTAFADYELRQAIGEFALDGYLEKPFTLAELREIVTRVLGLAVTEA